MPKITAFINGYLCLRGKLDENSFFINRATGLIFSEPQDRPDEVVDLTGKVIAPAYIELQTNGCVGVHFTHYEDPLAYQTNLKKVSEYMVSRGVGGFWATVPTVLPQLRPQEFAEGATLLGAHTEGPWLNPTKKGAHDSSLMQSPIDSSPTIVYGESNIRSNIKMVTLAPELPGSLDLIRTLTRDHGIVVSLGHSAATYECGIEALRAGAQTLTHVFNAMNPLHHRTPGLAGLIASPAAPFYSLIPDGIHLHPATLTLAFRANPERCILITDSIEMAGLPDGLYPGHSQIPREQRKEGNKVTIDGTDTLIGSCSSIDECVRNLMGWSGCSLPEAVRCVTENFANLMKDQERGMLEQGRRADFVLLDSDGYVLQTWIKGARVFER
ncbi:MAG: N-acetylglucosamine-6-phosphate deacetylase [Lasallia pustulata]|uniref:N-acetylglucosamine-6-phosphate deacetylase n=1 Tax=Lasallia pustulata TaxID=136370 RepID=A0A5M8Q195_9LECA|nr:MAG: N-acetylglucosamine-6-phosphate deacetylase [Lasallia pustulata]